MAARGYVTLTTTPQQIHDGSCFCYIRCASAVLHADTSTASGTAVVTAPADENNLLPMGKATWAWVASGTATCYLIR